MHSPALPPAPLPPPPPPPPPDRSCCSSADPAQAKIRLLLRVFAATRLPGIVRRPAQACSRRSIHSWGSGSRHTHPPSSLWTFTQTRVPWLVACAEAEAAGEMGKNDLSAANTTASVQVRWTVLHSCSMTHAGGQRVWQCGGLMCRFCF